MADAQPPVATQPPAKPEAKPVAQDYTFHPLAEKFPLMKGDNLNDLSADIADKGLIVPIILYDGMILDGRNRYNACKQAGRAFAAMDFRQLPYGMKPEAYVISANIHRRHLTVEQKRTLLAELIKLDPSKSNRQIATDAKVSHHTVGDVREELEATGQVAQLETTTGKDGKKRRTKRGGAPKGPKGGKPSEMEKITYAYVTDAKTALNAYSVLEEHLLDALQDLNQNSSFAHAQEYGERTIEKLQEKLSELQLVEDEAREEEKRHVAGAA